MKRTIIAGLALALIASAVQAADLKTGDLPNMQNVAAGDTPDMWKKAEPCDCGDVTLPAPAMTPQEFEKTLRNPFAFDAKQPLTAGYLVLGPVLGVATGAAMLYVAGEILPMSGSAAPVVVVP